MTQKTQTAQALHTLLDTAGFSKSFLWDLTDYSPTLLTDAHREYIEFFGPVQDKLERLAALYVEMCITNPDIDAATFMEKHVFLHPAGTKPTTRHNWIEDESDKSLQVYSTVGDLWIAKELSDEAVLALLMSTDAIEDIEEFSEQEKDNGAVRYVPECVAIHGSRRRATFLQRGRYGKI